MEFGRILNLWLSMPPNQPYHTLTTWLEPFGGVGEQQDKDVFLDDRQGWYSFLQSALWPADVWARKKNSRCQAMSWQWPDYALGIALTNSWWWTSSFLKPIDEIIYYVLRNTGNSPLTQIISVFTVILWSININYLHFTDERIDRREEKFPNFHRY